MAEFIAPLAHRGSKPVLHSIRDPGQALAEREVLFMVWNIPWRHELLLRMSYVCCAVIKIFPEKRRLIV